MKRIFLATVILMAFAGSAFSQTVSTTPDPTNAEPSMTAITREEASLQLRQKQMIDRRSTSDTIDMARPYKGEPAPENDGLKRNQRRNLNYNSPSVNLPPNTGRVR